jgi:hypothetical protein
LGTCCEALVSAASQSQGFLYGGGGRSTAGRNCVPCAMREGRGLRLGQDEANQGRGATFLFRVREFPECTRVGPGGGSEAPIARGTLSTPR